MEAAKRMKLEFDDITECIICKTLYTNPKSLACLHVFCLDCLQKHVNDRGSKDKSECPRCGKEFTISQGTVASLPGNSFVENLVLLRRQNYEKDGLMCEVCAEENEKNPGKVAKWHCVICAENLCNQCCANHKRARLSKSHEVVEIGKEHTEHLLKCKPSLCAVHPDEHIKLYCSDCKLALCMMCHYVGHKLHKTCNVTILAEQYRQDMQHDTRILKENHSILLEKKRKIVNVREKFCREIQENRDKISMKITELTELVKNHGECLLQELNHYEKNALKQLEANERSISTQLDKFESFSRYLQTVVNKAASTYIVDIANDAHERAIELQEIGLVNVSQVPSISFLPSNIIDTEDKEHLNMIGKIKLNATSVTGLQIIK